MRGLQLLTTVCVALAASRTRPSVAPDAPLAAAVACASVADCSGAGSCVSGACVCEPGFIGDSCAALDNRTAIPVDSGFRMAAYHVWGSQVVFDEASALFHMLASIYPVALPFYTSWLYCAQIAHATSPTALGPFAFQSIVLPYGAADAWDRSVMNPKILRAPREDSVWLLYYVGSSYDGPTPGGAVPLPVNQSAAQASQRVGLATAPSPSGPYTRYSGAPVLLPRPGMWDSRMTTNPAVVAFGGTSTALLMVYKASSPAGAGSAQTRVCLGVAIAASWQAPFERIGAGDPILPCPDNSFYSEDPTVWRDARTGFFHLVFKDFAGHWTRDGYSGAHAISVDGIAWKLTTPALAYTTRHRWSDGVTRVQAAQERAQVLLDDGPGGDGAPLAMFFATSTALNGSQEFFNMAMPLR